MVPPLRGYVAIVDASRVQAKIQELKQATREAGARSERGWPQGDHLQVWDLVVRIENELLVLLGRERVRSEGSWTSRSIPRTGVGTDQLGLPGEG